MPKREMGGWEIGLALIAGFIGIPLLFGLGVLYLYFMLEALSYIVGM